ncbi:probable ubiquitin-like-specific protease 2A isoform X2 [Ziziphus jujuba]|uniref:Probable ubiquitin-like-specific protease 2A isoform X2 n=1 Tax=Ziziphus jujuba TaxID=326968 RepID=A0A6P4AGJ8_ZIZJJ|nr:probable ubiquitin-like-specific protease 2A isoform X2 [Ziziphus jujuba]
MTRPSKPGSAGSRFQVFDFNDDDERVEKTSNRYVSQFLNPKKKKTMTTTTKTKTKTQSHQSPITKYQFLQCFAPGTEIVDKVCSKDCSNEFIDLDAEVGQEEGTLEKKNCNGLLDFNGCDIGRQSTYTVSNPINMPPGDGALKEDISGLDAYLISTSSNPENEPVDTISDDDDSSIEISSPLISTFSAVENLVPLDEQFLESGSGAVEIDQINMTVTLFPDFILYGDRYCKATRLTFSCSCIKLEGSLVNGISETFRSQWATRDIISIESQWCQTVETATIKLHLKSKDSKGNGKGNCTSGIQQLTFGVYDPHWLKNGEKAIKLLDAKYKDIWNTNFNPDVERDKEELLGRSWMSSSKHYFPNLDEPFKDVIYPKGDPDAVSISKSDIELLQPGTFINDTIIDFYIKYLKNNIQPEEQHRFHFFNSFFFRKLADLDKDPSCACEGKAAFQRVRKWTRKVNIFEKDYIFIPVNYSLHWSLLVICHPGEVANFEVSEGSSRVPCILHMDSIRGSHRGLKNLVQSYLCEEWKERHSGTAEDISSKFLELRFVPLEQENSFDCGLFLLHYVELFLEQAPLNFSPFNIMELSTFLNRNWFPPTEASLKRTWIMKLIHGILEDHSQQAPADSTDKHSSPVVSNKTDSQATGVMYLDEICTSTEACDGNSSSSNVDEGIRISSLEATSPRGVSCSVESGLGYGKLFDPGNCARSLSDVGNLQLAPNCPESIISLVEGAEETDDLVAKSQLGTEDHRQVVGLASDLCSTSYMGTSFGELETTKECEYSMPQWKSDGGNSVSRTGKERRNLPEVGIDQDRSPPEIIEVFSCLRKPNEPQSSSTWSEELADCVVEDSEEADSMHESRKLVMSTAKGDSVEIISPKPVELQVSKRQRLVPPEDGKLLFC